MSKLNRREFKELLTEWKQNFINEMSRQNKIFFSKNKHPSLKGESEVLFIHWFRPFHKNTEDTKYEKNDARRYIELGSERLKDFIENKLNKREIACNLLAPSNEGLYTDYQYTHNFAGSQESWGYLGVVIKGYPTFGSLDDNNSMIDITPSGPRIRTYGWNREENIKSLNYIDYESISNLYKTFDKEDEEAFSNVKDIEYWETEFFVKPTKILSAVLYINQENALESVIGEKLYHCEQENKDVYNAICKAFSEDTNTQIKDVSHQELMYVIQVCKKNNISLKVDPKINELNNI